MAASLAYMAVFLAAGLLAARRAVPTAGWGVWVPLGCGFAIALLAGLPALAALALGFTLPAVLAAGAAALALAAVLAWRRGAAGRAEKSEPLPFLLCVLPLFAFTCVLLHTHVLHLMDGAYHTGQSCYGDMAMHLTFIKSMAVRGAFPPVYPLLAGAHSFGYPFLCESVSAVFLLLGADLRTAYLLPMLPAFVSVYGMLWQLARRVLGGAGKACLAFWLFFLGSGFGFVYFLGSPEAFKGIFTGFYTTPTNFVEKNVLWVNPIADLLLPQRATLFGWCVLFPALYLLWRFCYEGERRLWLPLALLVLPLPLLHTHSALALVLACLTGGVYTLLHAPRTRAVLGPWLGLAALCGAVWLWQMWGTVLAQSVDGEHMLRLHFNWVNNNGDGTLKDNYFWFYIKNIGLVYLLLVPAFLHANAKQRWFYGGGLMMWALAECVLFQPNPYDNNKLLFIWHMLGCLLAANLLWDAGARLAAGWRVLALGAACFVGMFGSVLTLGRELVSDYTQWSAGDIALAAYVDEHAAPDALFLTSDSHLTPVACLAGRQIVCGSGSFVYYHGMDYAAENAAMRAMYETPDEGLLAAWGVDYVLFDSYVSGSFDADEGWYAARYPVWYNGGGARIYQVGGE